MLFKKRKEIPRFVKILKERPDEFYICSEYIAVWLPELERALFIFGDYTKLGEEEVDLIFQDNIKLIRG